MYINILLASSTRQNINIWRASLSLARCAKAVQQELKHWCVINIFLITNLKYGIIQAAMKKI